MIGPSRSCTLCIGLLKGGTKLLKGGTKSWGWATGGGGGSGGMRIQSMWSTVFSGVTNGGRGNKLGGQGCMISRV